MFYAGIGSRQTPPAVLTLMTVIGRDLAERGLVLRSGGANGADTAFETGARSGSTDLSIFLPWKGFNGRKGIVGPELPNWQDALEMAARYHPAWHRCSNTARAFHARNCYQVLGTNLETPSRFVICWTPGGSGSGGTGQALRIARDHNIVIRDLGDPTVLAKAQAVFS